MLYVIGINTNNFINIEFKYMLCENIEGEFSKSLLNAKVVFNIPNNKATFYNNYEDAYDALNALINLENKVTFKNALFDEEKLPSKDLKIFLLSPSETNFHQK